MKLGAHLKIAITGANGQLGFQLVKKLTGKVALKAFDKESLDIADQGEVETTLIDFAPDIIINAAAYTAVDKAEQDLENANAINHLGPGYLALTAEKLKAVLIHVSTDYVFDGKSSVPYRETDKANPHGVYGKTKLDGELAVVKHCSRHIILRTSWVFAEHGNNFVKTMLRLGSTRTELSVVSDQIGAPTYAGDIAEAVIEIISQLKSQNEARWGIYHYSGEPYSSWHSFAEFIFDKAYVQQLITNKPTVHAITTDQYPTPAKRPTYSMLDCRKIHSTFGIKPSNWHAALRNLTLYK